MARPSLIDTHAHLDNEQFNADRDEVIARAHANGISHILTIGCDLDSSQQSVAIAKANPCIYAAVGIHPHDAAQVDDFVLDQLRNLATNPDNKVVAIGEIGLDFYRDRSPRDIQRQVFRQQIQLARELNLPIIVHDRDAHDEVLAILQETNAGEIGGVLHCFSGDLVMAKACLDLGLHLSFTATVTYPKNEPAREIISKLPVDRLLIETDCPYLAPQSRRGKRNEPALVRSVAETIASVKGLTEEDVARITSLNAFRLFGIGDIDQSAKIAYPIRNSLYLNITNRCTNSCTFCAKFRDFTVKGHQLHLDHEPSTAEIISAIGTASDYEEVVFCGYGESLLRLDTVKEVATWLKQQGVKVRINTDGQANLVHGRNIIPELQGLVDEISVSLNAADPETYQKYCRSTFGLDAYQGVKDFLTAAKGVIPSVTATVVTLPGLDLAACRKAAEELGVEYREREYNEVG